MYQIREDDWADVITHNRHLIDTTPKESQLPVAIETEQAFVFRDTNGKIVHKYPIKRAGVMEGFGKEIEEWIAIENTFYIKFNSAKHMFLRAALCCIEKLYPAKKRFTFLEIGSLIGENYYLLKRLMKERCYNDVEIYFIGVELVKDRVNFSRLLMKNDTNFCCIEQDGSDLSFLKDEEVDFTISNGVAHLVNQPTLAFSELYRVARYGLIGFLQVTEGPAPFYLTGGDTGIPYFIPTRTWLSDCWKQWGDVYDYRLTSLPFSSYTCRGGGSGYYLGGINTDSLGMKFEHHLCMKYPMFPEIDAFRLEVS